MKIVRKIIILMILVLLMSVNIFADEEDRIYVREKEYTEIEIKIFEGEEEVEIDENFGEGDSKVVWIYNNENGNPHMPDLRIVFEPRENLDYHLTVRLKVEYYLNTASGKRTSYVKRDPKTNEIILITSEDVDYFPDYDGDTSTCVSNGLYSEIKYIRKSDDKVWVVDFGEYFCGGEATLYWQLSTDEVEIVAEGEYVFYIRGRNPIEPQITNYVGDERWYYAPLVRHESSSGQFNPIGSGELNRHYGPEQEDFEGCPNWGTPDGWGAMQLETITRYYRPDEKRVRVRSRDHQLLWNWQYNVDTGIAYIEDTCVTYAERIKRNQLDLAVVSMGNINNVPEITMDILAYDYGEITFQDARIHPDAEYTFLDALAIKRYNGASRPGSSSGGHFIYWNIDENRWDAWELNNYDPSFNYVARICQEY